MIAKFKFAAAASTDRMKAAMEELAALGFEASRLFPKQNRPGLDRVYRVDMGRAEDVDAIKAALLKYDADVEYVEGPAERTPLG